MMPNVDPRQLKRMMESMGIRSSEIEALRVVIEGKDRDIVIDNPQVMQIDAQGTRSFQINGDMKEVDKVKADINDDDIALVMEKSGVEDRENARKALEDANGDIAAALIALKEPEAP